MNPCGQIAKEKRVNSMYTFDNQHQLIEAKFDRIDAYGLAGIVVESRGGGGNGQPQINPGYNALMRRLLAVAAGQQLSLSLVTLESRPAQAAPADARILHLASPYPLHISAHVKQREALRTEIGRVSACMFQKPGSKGGNPQKRIGLYFANANQREALIDALASASIEQPGDAALQETEREQVQKARIGQSGFRQALELHFKDGCPLTGISTPALLVASHIKPWRDCTPLERLDPDNGLLLSALADRLFDRGLITFDDHGTLLTSPALPPEELARCHLQTGTPLPMSAATRGYMAYHRAWCEREWFKV